LTALIPASLVIVLTTVIGVAAGVLPARRAAKLDPVESLRAD
jgi:ABC-type antimicrobial peptide transport system permease subunit